MSFSPSFPQPGAGYPGAQAHGFPPQGAPHSPQPGHHQLAPPPSAGVQGGARNIDTNANFEGAAFRISYRDSNSLLSVRLQQGYEIKAKSGSMVAMDATVKIRGQVRFMCQLLCS